MMKELNAFLEKAKLQFESDTGLVGTMSCEYVIWAFLQDFEICDIMERFFKELSQDDYIKKYKDFLKNYASGLYILKQKYDEPSYKKMLETMTNQYNEFILFLITQDKLVPNNLAQSLLLTVAEYGSKSSLMGENLENNGINKDTIISIFESGVLNKTKTFKQKISELLESHNVVAKKSSDKNPTDDSSKSPKTTDNPEQKQPENQQEKISMVKVLCQHMDEYLDGYPWKCIGQEEIFHEMDAALLMHSKQGIILVGDSGVGKDEIICAYHQYMKNSVFTGDVQMYRLNLPKLMENYEKGALELKLKGLCEELESMSDTLIYIEDLEILHDSMLPERDLVRKVITKILSSGVRIITSCTTDLWQTRLGKENTLFKAFYMIEVKEPSKETIIQIVKKNMKLLEGWFNVKYDKKIAETIVSLANQYIQNDASPRKELTALDICTAKFVEQNVELIGKKPKCTVDAIVNNFAQIYNLKEVSISDNEIINIDKVVNNLKAQVIDQDEAIDKVIDYIMIGKAGLREDNKTVCNIFLKAQSGVGKTYLCQKLAEELNLPLVRFDMSEYVESHSVSKFLGTPPGYVGFQDSNHGSLLITALQKHPTCVLLLDEIEKANATIHNALLQAMDNGMVTSSSGKQTSLQNVILIMTSNVGATASAPIAFGESTLDTAQEEMNEIFKPEFRTRLDAIITMNPVSKINVKRVIKIEIDRLNNMLKRYKKTVEFSKESIELMDKRVKENNLGLRILKHIIDSELKTQIVRKLNKKNKILKVVVKDNKLEVV